MKTVRGKCSVWFAFDIGHGIDLEAAARRLGDARRARPLDLSQRAPKWFRFAPSPLEMAQECEGVTIGSTAFARTVKTTLFEFGAVSLEFQCELEASLEGWIELSRALADDETLEREARHRVELLSAELGPAITRAGSADLVEDYVVFHFGERAFGVGPDELLASHGEELAKLLRAETAALSSQEVTDALSLRLSFQPTDMLAVDWHGALLIDDAAEDVLRVLEYANVQLLELRFLDAQLDVALDRAYELLARRNWRKRIALFGLHRDLDRVSAMQVDAAILFERVGNTLKLVGDPYLARVLRAAGQRFRSAEWNSGILRKLDTLDDIYGKVHDQSAAVRAEFLEWIIVLLIAFEIAWSLVGAR